MKKILSVILLLTVICFGSMYVLAQNKEKEVKNMSLENKKILIAYFSWGGNTKFIAEKIRSKVNADMFQIEPVVPYPTDYNETAYGIAKTQKEKGTHPPIKNTDIKPYDVIFVGTPAWWYTMTPPVMTFLAENNFEGKTIIPFITHGGGGGYTINKDMAELAKGSRVLSPLVVYERGTSETEKEIVDWINKLNKEFK